MFFVLCFLLFVSCVTMSKLASFLTRYNPARYPLAVVPCWAITALFIPAEGAIE